MQDTVNSCVMRRRRPWNRPFFLSDDHAASPSTASCIGLTSELTDSISLKLLFPSLDHPGAYHHLIRQQPVCSSRKTKDGLFFHVSECQPTCSSSPKTRVAIRITSRDFPRLATLTVACSTRCTGTHNFTKSRLNVCCMCSSLRLCLKGPEDVNSRQLLRYLMLHEKRSRRASWVHGRASMNETFGCAVFRRLFRSFVAVWD